MMQLKKYIGNEIYSDPQLLTSLKMAPQKQKLMNMYIIIVLNISPRPGKLSAILTNFSKHIYCEDAFRRRLHFISLV